MRAEDRAVDADGGATEAEQLAMHVRVPFAFAPAGDGDARGVV